MAKVTFKIDRVALGTQDDRESRLAAFERATER